MGAVINDIVDFGDISHIQMVVEAHGDVTVKEAFDAGIEAVANTSDNALYSASEKSRAKLYEPTVNDFMTAAREGNPLFAIVVTAQLIAQAAPNDIKDDKVLPIPPKTPAVHQTSIVSRLDLLEEATGIKK
eukprot:635935-Ditylum_brightwellii.AAC.1